MHEEPPLARRDAIAERLDRGEAVVAAALAAEFHVSEDAIRRDLRALAAAGRCRRVYGGALPAAPAPAPMAARMEAGRGRKDALARAAATLVAPDELLFLDGGSTNLALAGHLPPGVRRIATNSVDIAADLLRRGHGGFVLLGGAVDPIVGGAVDATALEGLGRLNIDCCVLGACAVSAAIGISAHDPADAAFKRALVAASRRVIALATSDKLGTHAAHRVARVDAIERIVVEHDAPEAERVRLGAAGARLLVAEP